MKKPTLSITQENEDGKFKNQDPTFLLDIKIKRTAEIPW